VLLIIDQQGHHPFSYLITPSPGDWGVTELAPAIIYVEFANFITDSPNQNLLAVVAVGIVCIMTRHIPKVDIMNPLLEGYIPQKFQGFHWRSRQPVQFIPGEEAQKV